MPKDPPSHPGSNSHSHLPYPSSISIQDGRIRVPRSGPISRNSPNAFPPSSSRTPAVGTAHVANSAPLVTVSPQYNSFAQLPPFHGESPVYTPPGLSQYTPPYPDSTGCLQPSPPHALAMSRFQQPTQNTIAQLQSNRHGPMVEPPKLYNAHSQLTESPVYDPPDLSGRRQRVLSYPDTRTRSLMPLALATTPSQQLPQNMIAQLRVRRDPPLIEAPAFYSSHSQLAPSSIVQPSPPDLYSLSPSLLTRPFQSPSSNDVVLQPLPAQRPVESIPEPGPLVPPAANRAVAPMVRFAPQPQPSTSQRPVEDRVQRSIGAIAGSITHGSPRRPPPIRRALPPLSSIPPAPTIVESQSLLFPSDLESSSQIRRHTNSESSDHRSPVNDLLPPQLSAPVYMYHPDNVPPSCPQPFEVGSTPRPRPRRIGAARSNRSFLEHAQNFQMRDLQCIDANNVTIHSQPGSIDGWELLLEHTAPNALHNSHARYDAPKCDEDTRVEVTNELTTFLEDRDGPQRLLCMTGAAGSGKSALQQTVAEKCGGKGTLGASFFFSAADSSRNTVGPVIPTIAYQLGRKTPRVQMLIKTAVEEDRLVFSQSLKDQITALIVKPFERLGDEGLDLSTLPRAILIDGLDECRGEDSQAELLTAIAECLLVDHLPFRIFIASRPEWAIRTALQPGGYLHALAYHIQLSDNYDASGDMCRYLTRRFDALSYRTGNPHWYTPSDINTLVSAASGQFVYVAVVFKYISERRGSPAERLKIVLTWTPHQGGKTRPFEGLDILYRHILTTAKNAYDSLDTNSERDFLLLLCTYHANMLSSNAPIPFPRHVHNPLRYSFPPDSLTILLGLEAGAEEILFSDLHSLFALEGSRGLRVYHKSFYDFLEEKSRAGALFVANSRIRTHLAMCCMQTIIEYPSSIDCCVDTLPGYLVHAINALPLLLRGAVTEGIVGADFDSAIANFGRKGGWRKLDRLLPVDIPLPWYSEFQSLIRRLKPDTAALVREFAAKFEHDHRRDVFWPSSLK